MKRKQKQTEKEEKSTRVKQRQQRHILNSSLSGKEGKAEHYLKKTHYKIEQDGDNKPKMKTIKLFFKHLPKPCCASPLPIVPPSRFTSLLFCSLRKEAREKTGIGEEGEVQDERERNRKIKIL